MTSHYFLRVELVALIRLMPISSGPQLGGAKRARAPFSLIFGVVPGAKNSAKKHAQTGGARQGNVAVRHRFIMRSALMLSSIETQSLANASGDAA